VESLKQIGERIVELRTSRKLTQQKFAYVADMERTYLNHIEKGRKNISIGTLERILTALNVSFKEFFESDKFAKEKKK
jgi:transcriptional regulator with XRE-family HTH domain